MKLLTHNLLMCNKKTCGFQSYPLKIAKADKIVNKEHEYDNESMDKFIKKIDWNGLKSACNDLNIKLEIEDYNKLSDEEKTSDKFYEYMNNILFQITIQDGILKCNNCGREYPIVNGIIDLVLKDDEL